MNTHVKITQDNVDRERRSEPPLVPGRHRRRRARARLFRRPGLVGADDALAATSASFEPSVWYSIAPTGSSP